MLSANHTIGGIHVTTGEKHKTHQDHLSELATNAGGGISNCSKSIRSQQVSWNHRTTGNWLSIWGSGWTTLYRRIEALGIDCATVEQSTEMEHPFMAIAVPLWNI